MDSCEQGIELEVGLAYDYKLAMHNDVVMNSVGNDN